MFNGITNGVNAGLSVLGAILGIMVFIMIVKKGPGLFRDLADLITNLVKLVALKLQLKVMATKEPELQELDGSKSKPEPPTFDEWLEWKRSTKS